MSPADRRKLEQILGVKLADVEPKLADPSIDLSRHRPLDLRSRFDPIESARAAVRQPGGVRAHTPWPVPASDDVKIRDALVAEHEAASNPLGFDLRCEWCKASDGERHRPGCPLAD